MPLLDGGGVLDVETEEGKGGPARTASREDFFHRRRHLQLDAGGDQIRGIHSNGESHLELRDVHLSSQPIDAQARGSPRITVTPLPKIPAMVAASPFSFSFSRENKKAVNVLGSFNTTMFTLNLRTGAVSDFICASQHSATTLQSPQTLDGLNEQSKVWIGRTDSVLRAFDRRHNQEMWNVSTSQVQPQPIGGLSDPPQRVYRSSAGPDASNDRQKCNHDSESDDVYRGRIFVDEIVTRAGFHATFMETCTDVSNRRRDSHILWDTTTAANNLAFPISSAYLVGGVQDDLRVSAIPIKHMVPKPRRESSPFARLEDEVYIHAFGEGTEMFGLSSKAFFQRIR